MLYFKLMVCFELIQYLNLASIEHRIQLNLSQNADVKCKHAKTILITCLYATHPQLVHANSFKVINNCRLVMLSG